MIDENSTYQASSGDFNRILQCVVCSRRRECRLSKPLWLGTDQHCVEEEGAAAGGYDEKTVKVGSILGNYQAGYELGQVSMKLAGKYDLSFTKCIVYFTVGAIISH